MNNNNILRSRCQWYNFDNVEIDEDDVPSTLVPLSDRSRSGKERPWRRYKIANEYLAVTYDDINPSKSDRLRACGKCLTFDVDEKGVKRLVHSDSCRVRLCPICSWRRSLKCYYTTMSIIDYIATSGLQYKYLFVTLTVKNCAGDELSHTIDELFAAMKRFSQRKEIKRAFHGSVRNLEITHNVDRSSKSFDTYHPHFHCIFAVNSSYFHDSNIYLSRKAISEIWRGCLGVDYDVQVDVRACYDTTAHAVAEASKYAAKPSDYLLLDDWDLTIDTVRVLDEALANRRLVNYSGIFRDVKNKLNIDDAENGDLVHIGDGVELSGKVFRECYFWYSGYSQYYKIT